MNRKDFIKTTALAGASLSLFPSDIFALSKDVPKVRLAIIGVGERGKSHLDLVLRRDDVDLIAICDVDDRVLKESKLIIEKSGKKMPQVYTGDNFAWQKMLQKEKLDGVIIVTPWEWHKPMIMGALESGLKYVATEVILGITLQDHWDVVKAAEKNNPGKAFNKIVDGPWYHGQWASNDGTHLGNINFGSNTAEWYQQNIEVPFFNYFLKGKGSIDSIAEANIFITGANEWRSFSQWPPAEKQDEDLYLQPDGKLDGNKPTAAKSFSEYTSDPSHPVPYEEFVHFNRTRTYMNDDQRFAERRPDVLTFKTDTLKKDVTVTGNVIADLMTSISTTDADFVVKVIDVFPEYLGYEDVDIYAEKDAAQKSPMGGYEMLVRAEVFRGRYRKSYENPSAFTPGKVEEVKFELPSIAHTFKKGHRIMVQVQSSWFPLVDRNPQQFIDIYHCDEKDFIKSNIKIYHDAQHASKLILPVLK